MSLFPNETWYVYELTPVPEEGLYGTMNWISAWRPKMSFDKTEVMSKSIFRKAAKKKKGR